MSLVAGVAAELLRQRRTRIWLIGVAAVCAALLVSAAQPEWDWVGVLASDWRAMTLLLVFSAALFCELLDTSLGMGFGTTLTPVLLIAGFSPLDVVPAVLLSECVTGLFGAAMHHRDGNVDFRSDPQVRRILGLLLALTVLGAGVAALVVSTSSAAALRTMIAWMVVGVGVVIVLTARRQLRFRPIQLVVIGAVAAFNKALSGGGYGPLVTSGQVVSGVPARSAVAVTSICEGVTCGVGLAVCLALGQQIHWALAIPLTAGALASVPMATMIVGRLPLSALRGVVGIATILLGVAALVSAR
ncbi:MAG: sulfite exporter TauE/SafE family protein [Phycisphaerales bacterium]|nr:sulfite exporter TauE/SafE family protein [Phycisphaerales bacterium]